VLYLPANAGADNRLGMALAFLAYTVLNLGRLGVGLT